MKRTQFKATALAVSIVIGISSVFGQSGKFEWGLNLGFVVYQGDLTPEKFGAFKTQKFAVNLHADRVLSGSFALRTNLLISHLYGDDSKYSTPEFRQQRNFNFHSPLVELSEFVTYNITRKNYAEGGFSPYVFAGAGLAFLNIKRDWSRLNWNYFNTEITDLANNLAEDTVKVLPRVIPVIPFGGGFRYFFSPQWGLSGEASYRLSYNDYIDGFSKAANPDLNDHYMNYAIGIIYRPGQKNRLGCPSMQY